jgi:hypothetical protein
LIRKTKNPNIFQTIDFLTAKYREYYLELGVSTKNVIVMLLIVLAEAALR